MDENLETEQTIEEPQGEQTDWKAMAEDLQKQVESLTAEVDKQKGNSRKWENRAKASNKTVDERVADLERQLEQSRLEKEAIEQQRQHEIDLEAVAKEYGIEDKSILRGATIDELKAHAEQLKPYISGRRKSVKGGNEPGSTPKKNEKGKFVSELFS